MSELYLAGISVNDHGWNSDLLIRELMEFSLHGCPVGKPHW